MSSGSTSETKSERKGTHQFRGNRIGPHAIPLNFDPNLGDTRRIGLGRLLRLLVHLFQPSKSVLLHLDQRLDMMENRGYLLGQTSLRCNLWWLDHEELNGCCYYTQTLSLIHI